MIVPRGDDQSLCAPCLRPQRSLSPSDRRLMFALLAEARHRRRTLCARHTLRASRSTTQRKGRAAILLFAHSISSITGRAARRRDREGPTPFRRSDYAIAARHHRPSGGTPRHTCVLFAVDRVVDGPCRPTGVRPTRRLREIRNGDVDSGATEIRFGQSDSEPAEAVRAHRRCIVEVRRQCKLEANPPVRRAHDVRWVDRARSSTPSGEWYMATTVAPISSWIANSLRQSRSSPCRPRRRRRCDSACR
jgi:hypothetical protein